MASILLIDDDDAIRSMLERVLVAAGYRVETHRDGTKVALRLESTPPDLIVTDINMPNADGMEVMMQVRRSAPDLPVVAISGGGLLPKETLLDTAGVLGAVAVVEKPFTAEEILEVVRGALGRRES